jgi:hypothetical protein
MSIPHHKRVGRENKKKEKKIYLLNFPAIKFAHGLEAPRRHRLHLVSLGFFVKYIRNRLDRKRSNPQALTSYMQEGIIFLHPLTTSSFMVYDISYEQSRHYVNTDTTKQYGTHNALPKILYETPFLFS